MIKTAEQILQIDTPEKLFTKNNFKLEAKKLQSVWHPDKSKDPLATKVSAHINLLLALAHNITDWQTPGIFSFKDVHDKEYVVKYHQCKDLPIGKLYYGKTTIAYDIPLANKDLDKNVVNVFLKLANISTGMKAEFDRLIPKVDRSIVTKNSTVYIFKKTEDVIPLSDLLILTEKLDPKHVAWIGNRLFNLACFLSHNKLVYNAFTLDNIWISAKYHSCLLIGGFWYSTTRGTLISAIPGELLNFLPKQLKKDKISHRKYDIIAIKSVLIRLLGDPTAAGTKLIKDTTIPKIMLDFLRFPVSGDSIKEYQAWEKTVDTSFGKRKFIELNVDISKLYEEI